MNNIIPFPQNNCVRKEDVILKKHSDYRKGLDKFTNRTVKNEENTSITLDSSLAVPVQDLFNNKTEWVKEHEV